MKKILAVSSFIVFLTACGGGSGDSGGMSSLHTGGATAAGTPSSPSSSPGVSGSPPGASPPSEPASPGAPAAMDTAAFLVDAYRDGAAEIALSELAVQKATADAVKTFAQRMIADHTQASNEIRQLAQARNIALPNDLTTEQRAVLDELTELGGIDFDRAYMNRNVTLHREAVAQFRAQSMSGTEEEIRIFAQNTLPALQAHLLAAKGIAGSIDPATFLINMFVDGEAEILLSRLALERASSADVKAFAQRMIDDHTQANNEIRQLAQARGLTLPADLPIEHTAANEDLSTMSGADFDKAYMNHNVLVHALGVLQAREQSEEGTDSAIRAFAARTLPVLTAHLETADELYEGIRPSLLFLAFQDGMGEILLSKLALQKSEDEEVRQFARRMIDDHTRANRQIEQLARDEDRTLPREISPHQLRDYVNLSQLSGQEFDRAYMERNVDVHEKDVAHFQQHAEQEESAEVRSFAAATLPILSAHLESARQIRTRLNAGGR